MSEAKQSKAEATAKASGPLEKAKAAPETSKAPAARPDVVTFRNVTKKFGIGASQKVAIQNVSFTVEDLPNIGELIAIVGPSGCGKSTLLRSIAALKPHFPPTEGEIHVFGQSVTCPGPDRGLVD